jgi:hypothetical protein
MFSGFVNAQDTGAPDWINYSVFVENGLIFFVGHSEFRGMLCSCTGVELKQEDNDQEKSLEDMDPMELYLYSLELEKQATEGANE